jgi:hypothetical protein
MTLPRSLVAAVARAVERQGGDLEDVRDLLEVWERLAADPHGRLDALRGEAANPRCSCADGGIPGKAGRCRRCYGVPA